ncbi:hypothetical protein QUB60_29135 [Microcoleus sp. A2-C5]|uniref:B12-binding domain-containing radical SAM protein n=1 Tax=unclassified Microcoleus TaxID=2642155 RepID=UPI002FD31063
MVPAYTGISRPNPKPVDLLFINLSNWPGRPVYPYAFVQVSALARRAGLSVVRWDGLGLNRQQQLECITQLVTDHQPRAVAFTIRQADSTISDDYISPDPKGSPKNPWFPVEDTHAAIRRIREMSDAKIFVGGFTFTANPVSAAEYLQPDFGIIGEPDEFFPHFHEVLNGRTEGISNLLYRADGQWRQNQRVFWGPFDDIEYTEDIIDEIFRFHGERELRNTHLADVPGLGTGDDSGRSIAIEISRGCPCACAFCCEPKVKGQTVRLRNLDAIEAEIHNLLKYGLRYYWFVCSELNFAKEHVLALAERVIRINESLPRPIFWRSYFLPTQFNKGELRLLLRSGLLLEQNGPFSDLSDQTLKQMREPYRARHAIAHIKDIIELNEEPEFKYRRMPRWILWSWLGNPYASLDSVRTTLETFSKEKLDLQYDRAEGYPALRVYECLDGLPEDAKQKAIIVTQDNVTPKTLIHPSFYYSRELVEHFGGIEEVHDFFRYAHETFLSRFYRLTRDWRFFARSLGFSLLLEVVASLKDADLEAIQLPPWVEHPDLGELDPTHWRKRASVLLQKVNSPLEQLVNTTPRTNEADPEPDAGQAMLAFVLHATFSASRQEMAIVFEKLELPLDSEGYPPASSYLTLSTLMRFHATEASVLEAVKKDFTPKQLALFRYYLYAINVRLEPKYAFLAPK